MKKIAILTHCVANNYGANLQALSTACFLRSRGFEPVFLRWDDYIKTNTPKAQVELHSNFLKNNGFYVSSPCHTNQDFIDIINENDIKNIIVGSDCVLTYRSRLFPYKITRMGFEKIETPKDYSFPNPFWLPFLEDRTNVRRFLMSVSCGGSNMGKINGEVLENMRELISLFSFISVRDSFTQHFLDKLLPDKMDDILLTPDPVFGFNANVKQIPTKEIIQDRFHLPDNYIIVSFYKSCWPDQKWSDKLMAEAYRNGLKCVGVPMPQGGRKSSLEINLELPIDPIDWYSLIKYSNGYIGNNMHPVIVALHNGIPFFSYNIHGQSYFRGRLQILKTSKEYDLLKRFGLEKNVVPQPYLKFIDPKTAINKIVSTDKKSLFKISEKLQDDYLAMMESITNKFL